MKKFLLLGVVILIGAVFLWSKNSQKTSQSVSLLEVPVENKNIIKEIIPNFQSPLERAGERVTKKPFGILINPQTSPIRPERFAGYHTGTDFEIFPEELNVEVPVRAVCSGEVKLKKSATGYGGVVIQSCELDKEPITVIYGHLRLASVTAKVGDKINSGDILGILGSAYSVETSGERKHLHLGFHKGTTVSILGYVQKRAELSNWIDPCLLICQ